MGAGATPTQLGDDHPQPPTFSKEALLESLIVVEKRVGAGATPTQLGDDHPQRPTFSKEALLESLIVVELHNLGMITRNPPTFSKEAL